mmetsp:Transcript_24404/g.56565  ORF Transcript_24404/g.56565 Transcript_24404/m.56565 type:complete len:227 (+) Transcript_24404:360-1040(+)
MAVQVQEHLDALHWNCAFLACGRRLQALGQRSQMVLEGKDHGVQDGVRVVPHTIRVHPSQRAARVPVHHAIHIHHRDHVEEVLLAEPPGGRARAQEKAQEALHRPRPDDLAGMLPGRDHHRVLWLRLGLLLSVPQALADSQNRHGELPDGSAQLRADEACPRKRLLLKARQEALHHAVGVRGVSCKVELVLFALNAVGPLQRVEVPAEALLVALLAAARKVGHTLA